MISENRNHIMMLDTRKMNIFARGLFGHYLVLCINLQEILAIEYGSDFLGRDTPEGGGMYRWEINPSSYASYIDLDEKRKIKIIGVDDV